MQKPTNYDCGFTLLELLVAMAMLGVLATIALVQYAEYKGRGFDARAESTLRMVVAAEEAYFIENANYISCTQADCHSLLNGVVRIENGITLNIASVGTSFSGSATHSQGTGETFSYP